MHRCRSSRTAISAGPGRLLKLSSLPIQHIHKERTSNTRGAAWGKRRNGGGREGKEKNLHGCDGQSVGWAGKGFCCLLLLAAAAAASLVEPHKPQIFGTSVRCLEISDVIIQRGAAVDLCRDSPSPPSLLAEVPLRVDDGQVPCSSLCILYFSVVVNYCC